MLGDFKYQRASKLHYCFKSYGDFAELVDFAYWWSCIGKGLRLQPAQQAVQIDRVVKICRLLQGGKMDQGEFEQKKN